MIVYGTICLDQFVRVDSEGVPLSDSAIEMPGGEAFNTATALAGWGVDVLLTGTALGGDAESDRLRHLLDTHPLGLPRDFIPNLADAVTPVCTVTVAPDGERTMRGRGYAQALAPPPLPDAILQNRPIYICDPNLGQPAIDAALRAAELCCPVIAMDFAASLSVASVSHIVVTSREMLAKQGLTETPAKVGERLRREGAQTAIITLGAEGGLIFDRDEGNFSFAAYALPDIVDTTGAGDAFRAGLAFGLWKGMPLREMIRFASAAAALHCQRWGGGSRVPLSSIFALSSIKPL